MFLSMFKTGLRSDNGRGPWALARIRATLLALLTIWAVLGRTRMWVAAHTAGARLPAAWCRRWRWRWRWRWCWRGGRRRAWPRTACRAVHGPGVVGAGRAGVKAVIVIVGVGIGVRAVGMDALGVLHRRRRSGPALLRSPGWAAVWLPNGVGRRMGAVRVVPVASRELCAR